jgi:hypothetical protein
MGRATFLSCVPLAVRRAWAEAESAALTTKLERRRSAPTTVDLAHVPARHPDAARLVDPNPNEDLLIMPIAVHLLLGRIRANGLSPAVG